MYKIKGIWKQYFRFKTFYIEYDRNIESVPDSIAVIPFVCNILPLVWLMDAELIMDEIDEVFVNEIEEARNGFRRMYPMFEFNGKIVPKKIRTADVEGYVDKGQVAVFFSGGVDAFATLFEHMDEKPYLVTVFGSDVKLDDYEGIRNVREHTKETAEKLDLQNINIFSSFRNMFDEYLLGKRIRKSNDNWWHGFQCGLGLLGHMAPVAYLLGITNVYIASSFSEASKGYYTCGSDPTIDNHVQYGYTKVLHDGYKYTRQDKVCNICRFVKEHDMKVRLRVCYVKDGGQNCCCCEKCLRTIFEIISEGGDPNEFGFLWDVAAKQLGKKKLLEDIRIKPNDWKVKWELIQNRMKTQKDVAKEYEWLTNLSYEEFTNNPNKMVKLNYIKKRQKRLSQKAYALLIRIYRLLK